MLLLRNDLLKKVKQYDANLSVILQVYQVCQKYHYPIRSLKTFLQANLNFFVLLPQLTQQCNRLDLSNQELEGEVLIVTRELDHRSDKEHTRMRCNHLFFFDIFMTQTLSR
jgi:hypothetical protein